MKLVCKCNFSVHLTLSVRKSVPGNHGPFFSLFLSGFHFIEGRTGGDTNRLRKCPEHQRTVSKDFTWNCTGFLKWKSNQTHLN